MGNIPQSPVDGGSNLPQLIALVRLVVSGSTVLSTVKAIFLARQLVKLDCQKNDPRAPPLSERCFDATPDFAHGVTELADFRPLLAERKTKTTII